MSALDTSQQWTPRGVEELLYRRYIKNEDVSAQVLSAASKSKKAVSLASCETYDRSVKMLFHYVQNGPVAALGSLNVNTGGASGAAQKSTPLCSPSPCGVLATKSVKTNSPAAHSVVSSATVAGSAGLSRPPMSAPAASGGPAVSRRASPSTGKHGSVSRTPVKRIRVEWPPDVPTNAMLYSNSRSQVQHHTAQRLAAQDGVDPDLIFQQNTGDLPLAAIFAAYPAAQKLIQESRSGSGDWQEDIFTPEEEALYKMECGYRIAPNAQSAQ